MQITTIGIDLAKTVFQVHAVDADGATVIRKRLRRAEVLSFVSGLEPCLIGMEACATWTCLEKGESFPWMKGELDDEAEGIYARV